MKKAVAYLGREIYKGTIQTCNMLYFSHVQPFCEQAVSNLDLSRGRILVVCDPSMNELWVI